MHDGVAKVTNRQKTEDFISCYKKASNTHISKRNRWVEKPSTKLLVYNMKRGNQVITDNDLEANLKRLNANKAIRPDHITRAS